MLHFPYVGGRICYHAICVAVLFLVIQILHNINLCQLVSTQRDNIQLERVDLLEVPWECFEVERKWH